MDEVGLQRSLARNTEVVITEARSQSGTLYITTTTGLHTRPSSLLNYVGDLHGRLRTIQHYSTSSIPSSFLTMTQRRYQHYHTARRLWTNLESFKPGQEVTVTGQNLDKTTQDRLERALKGSEAAKGKTMKIVNKVSAQCLSVCGENRAESRVGARPRRGSLAGRRGKLASRAPSL